MHASEESYRIFYDLDNNGRRRWSKIVGGATKP